MPAEAEKEEKLRSEIAGIVQRILLLLIASDCLAPCVKWYTEQLICTTERWCKGDRSDPEFAVPPSLSGYAYRGFNFSESQSPKKKGATFCAVIEQFLVMLFILFYLLLALFDCMD